MRAAGRFRYVLEALLKQRRSEQDASAARERSARHALEAHVDEARRAHDALAGIEGALREARRAGAPIDPRQHESASLYVARMREAVRVHAGLDIAVGLLQHLLVQAEGGVEAEQFEVALQTSRR